MGTFTFEQPEFYLARLEDLSKGALVKGIIPGTSVSVVDVKWHGSDVVELTYKDSLPARQKKLNLKP